MRRDGKIIRVENPEEFLQIGDELRILAPVEYFTETVAKFGEEITPEVSTELHSKTAQIVVIKKNAVGKSLQELDIARKYGVLLTSVKHMSFEVPRTADYKLRKGDILTVVGLQENVDLLGEELGHVERDIAETDMVTFAFGIVFGVIVGLLAINVGQLSIGLGSAGGLLASGLVIGYLRSIKPTFGRLPEAARWILMDFGLLLFMAGVGLRAGGDILETFAEAGPLLVLAGCRCHINAYFCWLFLWQKSAKNPPGFTVWWNYRIDDQRCCP